MEQPLWRIDEGTLPGCSVGTVISFVTEGSSARVMREGVGLMGTLHAATTEQTSSLDGLTITLVNQTDGWSAVLSRTSGQGAPLPDEPGQDVGQVVPLLDQSSQPANPAVSLRKAQGAGLPLSRPWKGAKDAGVVLALIAVGVVLPAFLAVWSGSFNISHNDDFNYRRIALTLFQTGQVQLTGWTVMSLIGQLASVQPILWISGGASWAFGLTTAAFGVAAIVAGYFLARRVLSVPAATFATLALLFFPGFLLNSTSFMTDVPALAGELGCLALATVALGRSGTARWRWLTASLAVGCFAFSIREFAVAAPVAVLLVAAAQEGAHYRRYAVAGLVVLAACGGIYLITANLPGQGSVSLLADAPLSSLSIDRVRLAGSTLALVLSPALVVAATGWWRSWRLVDAVVGLVIGVALYNAEIVQLITSGIVPTMMVGNLIDRNGAPGTGVLAGDRPILIGPPLWDILNAVALAAVVGACILLASAIGRALRGAGEPRPRRLTDLVGSTAGLLATFALLYGLGLVAFGLVASTFDRYLWPLAIPLAALLLRAGGRHSVRASIRLPAFAAAAVLGLGLVATSFALVLNSDAFDSARWQMGDYAVAAGVAPGSVDAGMEWVGYNATGVATVGAAPTSSEMWYDAWWPSFQPCAVVSSSPLTLPGFRLLHADIEAYRLLLFEGPQETLYLYRVDAPGCP